MEIRRSVMGRPNLSVRITVRWSLSHWFWKRDAGRKIPAGASFPMRSLRSAGGASVSARTLGTFILTRPPRDGLGALRDKVLIAENAENCRGLRRVTLFLAAAAWACPKAATVGNSLTL